MMWMSYVTEYTHFILFRLECYKIGEGITLEDVEAKKLQTIF